MKIKKTILKIISLFLIIGLNCSGIFGVGETMAYLNDKEVSLNNTYTAGTLDFSLFSPQDNFIPKVKVENMEPGDKVKRMIKVSQEGSLSFKYIIRAEKISGDDDFCDSLELEAKLKGEIKYPDNGDSSLMNFYSPEIEMINPPGIDVWQFEISLPNDAPDDLQNKTCQFKFVFESWQDNTESCEENGFDDSEEIESKLSSSEWRIPFGNQFIGDEDRIKIVINKTNRESVQDMTDEDFCPLILPYEPSVEEDSELETEEEENINETEDEEIKEAVEEVLEDVEIKEIKEVDSETEEDDKDESETEDTEEEEEKDVKEEEFVLTPKEETSLDEDDNKDDGENDNSEDDIIENSLNKNSVDCVQVIN